MSCWHRPTLKHVGGSLRILAPIDHNGQKLPARTHKSKEYRLMIPATRIEQELAAAQAAQQRSNDGRARVCARRAVAHAAEAWYPSPLWRGDAMTCLRNIQQDTSFPLLVRQAAERLSTSVTHQYTAPFTIDPVADARLIIAHLGRTTSDNRPR
jgi:hypothetical protein